MLPLLDANACNAGRRESDVSPAAGTQLCSGCGEQRKSAMFSASSSSPSGLRYECKPCQALLRQRRAEKLAFERGSQPPPAVKHCPKCRQTLASSEFNRYCGANDGLQASCRACDVADSSARRLQCKPQYGVALPVATAGTDRFCNHCNTSKPWAEFTRNESNVYGIDAVCRACCNEKGRDRSRQKRNGR